MKSKRLVAIALLAAMTIPTAAAAQSNMKQINVRYGIQLTVNGVSKRLTDANGNEVNPFEYNGTTYVPIRGVAQAMGAQVGYNQSTNTAYIIGEVGGINPSYDALNQIYRATREMYESSNGLFSICINGASSQLNMSYVQQIYSTNMKRYTNACDAVYQLSPSDDYFSQILNLKTRMDTVKYNYEKTYEVVQNGMFTQVFLDRMNTYDIDASYEASMVSIECNRLLDMFE